MKRKESKRPLSQEAKRERAREYWRRWKLKHAKRDFVKFGWNVHIIHHTRGWQWIATKQTNGAVLENGYFTTPGLARADFYKATEE